MYLIYLILSMWSISKWFTCPDPRYQKIKLVEIVISSLLLNESFLLNEFFLGGGNLNLFNNNYFKYGQSWNFFL